MLIDSESLNDEPSEMTTTGTVSDLIVRQQWHCLACLVQWLWVHWYRVPPRKQQSLRQEPAPPARDRALLQRWAGSRFLESRCALCEACGSRRPGTRPCDREISSEKFGSAIRSPGWPGSLAWSCPLKSLRCGSAAPRPRPATGACAFSARRDACRSSGMVAVIFLSRLCSLHLLRINLHPGRLICPVIFIFFF